MKRANGFTLLELLITVAIVGLLASREPARESLRQAS